jgi:hypothetical protein
MPLNTRGRDDEIAVSDIFAYRFRGAAEDAAVLQAKRSNWAKFILVPL